MVARRFVAILEVVVSSWQCRSWVWILSAGVLSCGEFETAGIDALLDDEESYLAFPGERIATGRFSNLTWDGTDDEEGVALALNEEGYLTIAPFSGESPCTAGQAERFWSHRWFRPRSLSPGFVVYREAAEGDFGTLHVVDYSCRETVEPLEDARPVTGPFGQVRGLLAETGDGRLVHLDPDAGTVVEVGSGVTRVSVIDGQLWTIEAGEIVVSDWDLDGIREERRFGEEATQWVTMGGTTVFFRDASGISQVLLDEDDEVVPVVEDACDLGSSGSIAWYRAPCEGGELVVESPQGRFELPAEVQPPIEVRGGSYFYLTDLEELGGDTVGTLWQGTAPEYDFVAVGERVRLRDVSRPSGDAYRAVVDWNGDTGTLVEWHTGGDAVELAERVPGYGPQFEPIALVNWDGEVGDRVLLQTGGEHQLLAQGAPWGMDSVYLVDTGESEHTFLGDFADGEGELLHYSSGDKKPITVADSVRSRDFQLAYWSTPIVVYLRDFDETKEAGTLGAFFPEEENTFEVENGGTWSIVYDPEPGLLYTVTSGSHTGLWVAFAR